LTPDPERARKRRTQVAAITGLALVVVVAIVLATTLGGDDEEGAEGDGRTTTALLDGIPQDGTVLGEPDAPYTLTELADLQCPFCAQYSTDVLPAVIDEFVRDGELKLDLQLLTFIGPDSETAARIALALSLQGRYWNFAHLFYENQGAEDSGYVTDDFLRDLVEQIPGANFDVASADAESGLVTETLEDAATLAQENGVNSTPSFLIARGNQAPEPLPVETLDPDGFVAGLEERISAGQ
jgi:protein-disulfide isomerase